MTRGWSYYIEFRGQRFPLKEGTLTVGRSRYCDVSLDDPSISRKHIQLKIELGEVLLVDLGSSNGTVVNGKRVAESKTLSSGDMLRMGDAETRLIIEAPLFDDHDDPSPLQTVRMPAASEGAPQVPGDATFFLQRASVELAQQTLDQDQAAEPQAVDTPAAQPQSAQPQSAQPQPPSPPVPEASGTPPVLQDIRSVDPQLGALATQPLPIEAPGAQEPGGIQLDDILSGDTELTPEESSFADLLDDPADSPEVSEKTAPVKQVNVDLPIAPDFEVTTPEDAAFSLDNDFSSEFENSTAHESPNLELEIETPSWPVEPSAQLPSLPETHAVPSPSLPDLPPPAADHALAPPQPPTQSPDLSPDPFADPLLNQPAAASQTPGDDPASDLPIDPPTLPSLTDAMSEGPLSSVRGPRSQEILPSLDELEAAIGPQMPELPSPQATIPEDRSTVTMMPMQQRARPAGFWLRLIALLLDELWILALFLGASLTWEGPFDPRGQQLGALVASGISFIVILIGWSFWGTTPGKRLLGLYICGADDQPGIGLGRTLLRMVGYALSAAFLGIGFLLVAFHPEKKGLHDLISGTRVLRL